MTEYTDEMKAANRRAMNIAHLVGGGYDPDMPARPTREELVAWRDLIAKGEKPFAGDIDRMCFWLLKEWSKGGSK